MATFKKYETTKGTRWSARGYLGTNETTGQQEFFKKQGFRTKKEAQLSYSRAKSDYINGVTSRAKGNSTYEEVYLEWFEKYKHDVKESTAQITSTIFRVHIIPSIGHLNISKIDHRILQRYVNQWHKEFKRYKTMTYYMFKVFDYAEKMEYIHDNPKSKVSIPKKQLDLSQEKQDTLKYYNVSQLRAFIKELNNEKSYKWIAYFRLLAYTGIRRGEGLGLYWGDINFKESTLTVKRTLSLGFDYKLIINEPKTENSKRTVSIDPITLDILKKWKQEQAKLLLGFGHNALKTNQLLFSNVETNKPLDLTSPRYALRRICKRGNLGMINVHGFRHTHASLLFEAGVSMKDVMERMGHSDIHTTMNIYTHVTKDSFDKSAELFANYVNF